MKLKEVLNLLPKSLDISPPLPWHQSLPLLPTEPGIYWFQSSNQKALYVGKAKNLKSRISSYRLTANQVGKINLLVKRAKYIQYAILASEFQAILLEAEIIRVIKPKFNSRLKDDKSPLYVTITNEDYPRVLTTRKQNLDYAASKAKRVFGPYTSAWQAKKILKDIRKIFPYCNATKLQKQKLKACFYSHINLCCGACTGQVSQSHYQQMIKKLIYFLSGKHQKVIKMLKQNMSKLAQQRHYEQAAKIRDQIQLINLLHQAKQKRQSDEIILDKKQLLGLEQIRQLFNLKNLPSRIEAYDISNFQGKSSTGSMVVFLNGKPSPQNYRHFKIRNLNKPNDPAMITQIINRRLNHLEWEKPQLIIIDGGKAQVNAAIKALTAHHHAAKFKNTKIIGLAKRLEKIIYSNREIILPKSSPALSIIMSLRDEAHRFARKYYRYLHKKNLLPKNN